ncbi:GumC family protein [Nostoc parmelioides]|uniref:Polysaccharide biosynthesis tyrosine autokinase n=1 Tax=Nostoc parmelioides FACHB-3921 TaxID=2692909 RepID=A0ABR8BKY8_9NOSO|nr:exopolysaccharide transport family protein [Nostoc parmelioides]MBD2254568.1 polysaccharide biosynthesis tyrosine autokinase [Nostoc parmelioides FACHB-3921]
MNKQSYQTLNSEQNGNSKSFLPQPQPVAVPWGEEKDESFSIRDWLSIVKRRSRVIAGVSILVMTIVAVNVIFRKQPIEYESNFFMLVEPVNDDSEAINIVKETNSSTSKLDYDSQILVLKSPEVMRNTLQELRTSYPDITYPSLLESLTINRVEETKIIETRYRANDPNEVRKVLELISQDYLEYSQERRQTKLRQGIEFIDKQLPSIQERVDQIQQELQFFRQRYDFNSPESKGTALDAQASTLAGTQQSIKLQLTQVRDQLNLLQTEKGKTTVLNNASLYQQLVSQLTQLDTQIATESTLLESNNPRLQTLKEKRSSLLPVLQQEEKRFLDVRAAELRTQLQSLELQSAEIAKISQQLEQQRKQVPILARQYTEIQRKLQFANDSLNRFLSTRETLQIQISQTELGWQLIQPPSEPKLVNSSSRLRNLTIGLFASIVAGLAVALLLEKISNTYNSVLKLKNNINFPLLGNVPFDNEVKALQARTSKSKLAPFKVFNSLLEGSQDSDVAITQEYSSYSTEFLDALRFLYTNIQQIKPKSQLRSLVVSSVMAGDGKSIVAFYLAQTATAMGLRVLLVDANLRQPMIHNLANLKNLWGLSSLLSTNLPVSEVLHKLPTMEQLSLITAGPAPDDPIKLLASEKMRQLMTDFENNYDLVIYDAPHFFGLSDVSVISPYTDGVLMVVRVGKTDASEIEQALDYLKILPLNILGVVSNS